MGIWITFRSSTKDCGGVINKLMKTKLFKEFQGQMLSGLKREGYTKTLFLCQCVQFSSPVGNSPVESSSTSIHFWAQNVSLRLNRARLGSNWLFKITKAQISWRLRRFYRF